MNNGHVCYYVKSIWSLNQRYSYDSPEENRDRDAQA